MFNGRAPSKRVLLQDQNSIELSNDQDKTVEKKQASTTESDDRVILKVTFGMRMGYGRDIYFFVLQDS